MANLTNETLFDPCTVDTVLDPVFKCANQVTGGDYALMVMLVSFAVPFMISVRFGFREALAVGSAFLFVMSTGLLILGAIGANAFIVSLIMLVISIAFNIGTDGGGGGASV